jgi:glycerol-3-phosphate cytidylyltransferase
MVTGFTCGAFDLLHPGHILLLEWSRAHCDRLIVGLHTNPAIDRPDQKNRPIQSMLERWVQLRAVRYVDEIIPYDTEHDLENLIATLDIQVRFLGDDYAIKRDFTGRDIGTKRGISILYAPRLHSYSSTELRERLHRT